MNLFNNWKINFQGLSPFGKIAFWTKSVSEERERYSKCPYDGSYTEVLTHWHNWKNAGYRLPSEQDVKGYD
jgi:hypothetical protein